MSPAGERQAGLSRWVSRQHAGQLIRRTAEPYFNHLLRVAEMAAPFTPLGYEAGLCHDLIEKTNITSLTLLLTLPELGYAQKEAEEITAAVIELTDVYTKTDYPKLKKKLRKALEEDRLLKIGAIAQTVKYADLYDNILWMLKFEPAKTSKYLQRKKELISRMDDGDLLLRQRVLEFINRVN
jgi:(p)ppGpp synthase/HD superfamily hydrolase